MNEGDQQLLSEVQGQRGERTRPRFSRADALTLGQVALALAEQRDLPVVVRVRRGEQLMFHASREGTTGEHDDWVRRKINTALLHEVPSLELVLRQRISGRVSDWLDPHDYAVAGGAVPIEVDGNVVGALAVSGLVSSMRADHDLAIDALQVFAASQGGSVMADAGPGGLG